MSDLGGADQKSIRTFAAGVGAAAAANSAAAAAVSAAAAAASANIAKTIIIAASDELSPLTAGTSKVTFRMPYAMSNVSVRASLGTAQTSGTLVTVNIKESGTTILSTLLTIDNGEKTSTTATTPPVVSDPNLADDAEMTIDIDAVGDGTAKGLKVYIIGT